MGVGREQFLMKNDAVVTERAACFMKRFFFFSGLHFFNWNLFGFKFSVGLPQRSWRGKTDLMGLRRGACHFQIFIQAAAWMRGWRRDLQLLACSFFPCGWCVQETCLVLYGRYIGFLESSPVLSNSAYVKDFWCLDGWGDLNNTKFALLWNSCYRYFKRAGRSVKDCDKF